MHLTLLALVALAGSPETPDVGPLVRSPLAASSGTGRPKRWTRKNDQRVKGPCQRPSRRTA